MFTCRSPRASSRQTISRLEIRETLDEARTLIEKLPDSATRGGHYVKVVREKKITVGLKAADKGRVVSHEEA